MRRGERQRGLYMIGWTPAPHGLRRLPLRDIAVTAVVAGLCVSLARRPPDRIAELEREAESTEDMIARIERELDPYRATAATSAATVEAAPDPTRSRVPPTARPPSRR